MTVRQRIMSYRVKTEIRVTVETWRGVDRVDLTFFVSEGPG